MAHLHAMSSHELQYRRSASFDSRSWRSSACFLGFVRVSQRPDMAHISSSGGLGGEKGALRDHGSHEEGGMPPNQGRPGCHQLATSGVGIDRGAAPARRGTA